MGTQRPCEPITQSSLSPDEPAKGHKIGFSSRQNQDCPVCSCSAKKKKLVIYMYSKILVLQNVVTPLKQQRALLVLELNPF